jgi:hypothetical protein
MLMLLCLHQSMGKLLPRVALPYLFQRDSARSLLSPQAPPAQLALHTPNFPLRWYTIRHPRLDRAKTKGGTTNAPYDELDFTRNRCEYSTCKSRRTAMLYIRTPCTNLLNFTIGLQAVISHTHHTGHRLFVEKPISLTRIAKSPSTYQSLPTPRTPHRSL